MKSRILLEKKRSRDIKDSLSHNTDLTPRIPFQHLSYNLAGRKEWDMAVLYYQRFLDIWKEADPVIAEVEDVRERVAGLQQWT